MPEERYKASRYNHFLEDDDGKVLTFNVTGRTSSRMERRKC
jgi:hypothetical protein